MPVTKLRLARIRDQLTQAEVARIARTDQTTISAFERGTRVPTDRQLALLGVLFDISDPRILLEPISSTQLEPAHAEAASIAEPR